MFAATTTSASSLVSFAIFAAYSAGLAVGYWPDRAALRANRHIAAAWYPNMDSRTRRREAAGWKSAVARALTPADVGIRDDGS